MFPKLAALDLGSNSFHLAVFELISDRSFVRVTRSKEKVQLGRGCFESGVIDAETFERGLASLRRLRSLVDEHRPETVLAVATSALREAVNGAEFVRQASAVAGVPIRVISGQEEARLVWLGTSRATKLGERPIAIFDLGGGSTEVIVANERGCSLATSLRLGTLRLRSEWAAAAATDSPDPAWLEQRAIDVLEPTVREVARLGFESLVLSCGSARDLAALTRAPEGEPRRSEQSVLTRSALCRLQLQLGALDPAQRASLIAGDPKRADTLWVATAVFKAIFAYLDVERATVSSAGLREGLVADYLTRRVPAAAACAANA